MHIKAICAGKAISWLEELKHYRLVWIALIIVLASCGGSPFTQPASTSSSPLPQSSPVAFPPGAAPQHIFYIMMENHSASQILGNTADAPYLNQLANAYGTVAHYYGVTHPSLPNYLAAISGDFQGIWDDCQAGADITCAPQSFSSSLTQAEYTNAANRPHMFNGETIVDQLEAHHLTWKAYMQSMPSAGFTGASYGLYAEKHDPFMYFSSIRNNPARIQRIVPFTEFQQDLQSGNIANFVWISPDLCNDMHGAPDCSSYDSLIAQGDSFIRSTVQEIMSSAAWKERSIIVITWDENDGGNTGCCNSPTGANGVMLGGGDVPIIIITSHGPAHTVLANGSYNHYTLLATIEQLWNLGCLANACNFNNSSLMNPLFS